MALTSSPFIAGSPRVAVIRLYGWKYELFGPAGFSPMRSNRDRMKSAAARFSSVSVSRPRIESPARKNRSARRSSWRIDSFCGARCCAATWTAAATQIATRKCLFMPVIMHPTTIERRVRREKSLNHEGHERHESTKNEATARPAEPAVARREAGSRDTNPVVWPVCVFGSASCRAPLRGGGRWISACSAVSAFSVFFVVFVFSRAS